MNHVYFPHCHLSPLTAGLCGSPRITDVGGVPYLMPLVQKQKVFVFDNRNNEQQTAVNGIITHCLHSSQEYDMNIVAQKLELPGAFILGAAAGPARILGMNAEVIHFNPLSGRAAVWCFVQSSAIYMQRLIVCTPFDLELINLASFQ